MLCHKFKNLLKNLRFRTNQHRKQVYLAGQNHNGDKLRVQNHSHLPRIDDTRVVDSAHVGSGIIVAVGGIAHNIQESFFRVIFKRCRA